MAYLHDIGLGGSPEPAKELPDFESYFLSKNLEELIESGKDVMQKTFEMAGEDGSQFKACFRIEKITFAPDTGIKD